MPALIVMIPLGTGFDLNNVLDNSTLTMVLILIGCDFIIISFNDLLRLSF